ncbi:MAG: universal stress protein, partial [Terriglobia bacterium]
LATDFSVPAQRAYLYALKLASVFKARLVILTVLKAVPWAGRSQHLHSRQTGALLELGKLARLAEEAGRSPTPMLVLGSPSARISEIADEVRAALIVMGTHGRSGWDRLKLGSTAEAVVREAPCPVLTVRGIKGNSTSGLHTTIRLKRLLVPLDFSTCSEEALAYATRVAKRLGASVQLLHVREPGAPAPVRAALRPESEDLADQGRLRKQLQRRVLRLRYHKVQADGVIKVGTPGEVILAEAKDMKTDMIVMGTSGRRGLKRLVLGSVAEYVVRHASCPVLTLKTPH